MDDKLTSPLMINKITPFVDDNQWLKPTNLNSRKIPKVDYLTKEKILT